MNVFRNLGLIAAFSALAAPSYAAAAADPCAAIAALSARSDASASKELIAAITGTDPKAQACAVRAAGETKNAAAAEALLANVKSYLAARGPYEDNLQLRLNALDSIWSLGEIGDPAAMKELLALYAGSDDTIKINIVLGAGKAPLAETAGFLYKIAGSGKEASVVRAAAYEALAGLNAAMPAASLSAAEGMDPGDLVYSGGIFALPLNAINELPVGHSGIYGGVEIIDGKLAMVIYDCVPDHFKPYGGSRRIYSYKNFTHQNKYPFYGNRTSAARPTAAQRRLIIKAAAALMGHHYSDTHFSQKGPADFDCVGYTEAAYEAAGLNPTPDEYETGWGWPLTPSEQFDFTVSNVRRGAPALPYREPGTEARLTELLDANAAALTNAFGLIK